MRFLIVLCLFTATVWFTGNIVLGAVAAPAIFSHAYAGEITKDLEVDSGEEPANHTDIKALAAAAREPDITKRMAQLEKLLDVDRVLTFAALEVLLLH